ncbi:MAG: hypothetical protein JWM87_4165 [Candidatus Eremiobacteraeota bacterium]|nr:hypothetical protein [Candidatus Eremiobacteraeota bacterium]
MSSNGGLSEYDLRTLSHLAQPFWSSLRGPGGAWGTLPYSQLSGREFERLCFHILLADNRLPRFFGAPGVADYGVDLLCGDGLSCEVYQCKNVSKFGKAAFREWLDTFEADWLVARAMTLPRPKSFFLFWPIVADQREELETERTSWARRTGVGVEIFSREILDARLKKLPDVVADLFGDDAAEQFCGVDDWNQGVFLPLAAWTSDRRVVEPFLMLEAAGQIVRDAQQASRFTDILSEHRLVLFLGRSGSGKTVTALDLARSVDDKTPRRIYVLHGWKDERIDSVVNGIKNRATRPTLVLIDDAHEDLDKIEQIAERALRACKDRPLGLVMTLRRVAREFDDVPGSDRRFVEHCLSKGQVIELDPDESMVRRIVERAIPALGVLTREQLKRLVGATACDLALVRQALTQVESASDLDALDHDAMLRRMIKRYFPNPRVDEALERLAAVAQFDLPVPLRSLPQVPDIRNDPQLQRLIYIDGLPAKWRFVHSSLAELAFLALCRIRGEQSPDAAASRHLSAHLHSASAAEGFRYDDMLGILRTSLKFSDNTEFKRALLAEPTILAMMTGPKFCPPQLTSIALMLTRDTEIGQLYCDKLAHTIKIAPKNSARVELRALPLALRSLRSADATLADDVEEKMDIGPWLAGGTIIDLFEVLALVPPPVAQRLIGELDAASVHELVNRAILLKRPVGLLNLSVRALKILTIDDGAVRRDAVEQRIGTFEMLRLLEASGSFVDLMHILYHSSVDFAVRLVDALDSRRVQDLIERAIDAQHSIGTINFTLLRFLKDDPEALSRFNTLIGTNGWWRLVLGAGDFNDSAYIITAQPPEYQCALFSSASCPAEEDWAGLARRGTFYDVCRFIRDVWIIVPENIRERIRAALMPVAPQLVHRSTWFGLGTGLGALAKGIPDQLSDVLRRAAYDRLDRTPFEEMESLPFVEAASLLRGVRENRRSLTGRLAVRLWAIVPDEYTWSDERRFLEASRYLLMFCRDSLVAQGDVERAINTLSPTLALCKLDSQATGHLFLFLWSLWGLWFTRGRNFASEFVTLLSPSFWSDIVALLRRRVDSPGVLQERLNRMQLAGVIAMLVPTQREAVRAAIRSTRSAARLLRESDELTFVPHFFACQGLAVVLSPTRVFTPPRCREMIRKHTEYSEIGPDIDHLVNWLRYTLREVEH